MKKRNILLSLLPIILSSCGQNINNTHILRNGNLYNENIDEFENAIIHTSFENISSIIENEEGALLLLYSNECEPCTRLKPILKKYISNSKSMLYAIEVQQENEEIKKIMQSEYSSLIFQNGVLSTPSMYVIGENLITKIPNSRMENEIMLNNAMNDYVYYSNVYSFTNENKYISMVNDNKQNGFMSILIDRNKKDAMATYKNLIKNKIYNSKRDVALLDINDFDDKFIKDNFNIDNLIYPLGIYYSKDNITTHQFSPKENNDEFFGYYFN